MQFKFPCKHSTAKPPFSYLGLLAIWLRSSTAHCVRLDLATTTVSVRTMDHLARHWVMNSVRQMRLSYIMWQLEFLGNFNGIIWVYFEFLRLKIWIMSIVENFSWNLEISRFQMLTEISRFQLAQNLGGGRISISLDMSKFRDFHSNFVCPRFSRC